MNADRPPEQAAALPGPRRARQPTGLRRPFTPETVAAIRVLVETTTIPMRVIGLQVGVCAGSVTNLKARHGWTRPDGRRGKRPIDGETVGEARALIEGSVLSIAAIAERTG